MSATTHFVYPSNAGCVNYYLTLCCAFDLRIMSTNLAYILRWFFLLGSSTTSTFSLVSFALNDYWSKNCCFLSLYCTKQSATTYLDFVLLWLASNIRSLAMRFSGVAPFMLPVNWLVWSTVFVRTSCVSATDCSPKLCEGEKKEQ